MNYPRCEFLLCVCNIADTIGLNSLNRAALLVVVFGLLRSGWALSLQIGPLGLELSFVIEFSRQPQQKRVSWRC